MKASSRSRSSWALGLNEKSTVASPWCDDRATADPTGPAVPPPRAARRSSGLLPAVVVVEAHDVVLAEIVALLDLDEDEDLATGLRRVLDAVPAALGDVDALAGQEVVHDVVERPLSLACHHDPVFGTTVMELVAEPLTRVDGESLHLEGLVFIQHLEGSPRSLLKQR